MKHINIFILFIFSITVHAQDSVNIDEYGIWFFDNGNLNRIETEYRLSAPLFWNQYIIFHGANTLGQIIYNTENNRLSPFIYPGPFPHRTNMGMFNPIDKGPNLFFNFDGWEYEFDPVTLELINRQDMPFQGAAYEWFDLHWQSPHTEYLGERTYRFQNGDSGYFLDVIFGPNINIDFLREWGMARQGRRRQFIFVVADYYFVK